MSASLRLTRAARAAGVTAVLCLAVAAGPAVAQQVPFETVVEQLKSPDADTRLTAVKALGEAAFAEGAAPIAPLLADPDPRVQREALYAELAIVAGARRGASPAAAAFDANWGSMPADPVPPAVVTGLVAALSHPEARVRAEAAYALGVIGQIDDVPPVDAHKAIVDALAQRMGDASPIVRVAAARAAGRVFRRCPSGCGAVAVDRVGDALVHALNDPDPAVELAAMEGLGELRYARAVPALTDAYRYFKRGEMAYAALDTLSRIGDPSSVPLFQEALSNRDENLRQAAVEGLARSGGQPAVTSLDAMRASEKSRFVLLALEFAQQRSGRGRTAPAIVAAVGDRLTRRQAQEYLVELGPPVAPDSVAGLSAAKVEGRVALLEALGVIGSAEHATAIEPYERDPDSRVASAAARAVRRSRPASR